MRRFTGIAFIDSTPLAVCHNRRTSRHRVFKDLAARGKNSMGWFYGFKLHLIVSDTGDLLAVQVTPGNVDDRRPVEALSHDLFGKLFGDKARYLAPTSRPSTASSHKDKATASSWQPLEAARPPPS